MIVASTLVAVALVFPVNKTPDWGAMTTPKQWNRTYTEMKAADFVPVPKYDMKKLTIPTKELTAIRTKENNDVLTAKLFYSTRYCGKYDIDAGENIKGSHHCAIDLKLPRGTPLKAIASGKVTEVKLDDEVFGKTVVYQVVIDGKKYDVRYAHLETVSVRKGRRVRRGQAVGAVGLTGKTSAYHLHFEMRDQDGNTVNPMSFYPELLPK